MAEGGRCNIHAAGGTIVYCVNSKNLNHNVYKLQVLTVVTTNPAPKPHLSSKIGEFEGSAGHVLLKYPSGGMILTSMGHWVELMKIDTSEKKLFEVAENMYGASEVRKMREEYECMNVSEQRAYIETKGREFVRNQAPCNNMSKKSAW
jgi:Golgi nucleoside diphosphatase